MSPEELEFFAEAEALINPTQPLEIEYRLHYNDVGEIVLGTMTNHPISTNYIVVTKEQYDTYFHYRVVAGVLKKIDTDAGYRVQLRKSKSGYPTVAGHASLIVEADETYNNIEYYERNN